MIIILTVIPNELPMKSFRDQVEQSQTTLTPLSRIKPYILYGKQPISLRIKRAFYI